MAMKGSLFSVPTVRTCPVVKGSFGRMRIETNVWSLIAGATHLEKGCEWGAYLTGVREPNGWDVWVTGIEVPTTQVRSTGNVEFPMDVHREEIVGAIHSHHSMGAFWSTTDEESINKRFPTSIVVSTSIKQGYPDMEVLGVQYLATGRVKLKCGALGVVEFIVIPTIKG